MTDFAWNKAIQEIGDSMVDLKPCPLDAGSLRIFEGDEDLLASPFRVACLNDNCKFRTSGFDAKEEAVKAANTRPLEDAAFNAGVEAVIEGIRERQHALENAHKSKDSDALTQVLYDTAREFRDKDIAIAEELKK